jgi:hypothetical protein
MDTGGYLPGGKSGRGMKLTADLNVVPRLRKELYLHFPISLNGVVLNYGIFALLPFVMF